MTYTGRDRQNARTGEHLVVCLLSEWGETDHMASRLHRPMKAVLLGALSRMPRQEREMLAQYEACGWDIEKLSEQLAMDRVEATVRWVYAFHELGQALVDELDASSP